MILHRTAPSLRWTLPLRCGLAASGWLAVAASELPAGNVLRVLVSTLFLLLCPGLAAARWARPSTERESGWTSLLETAVLTVVVSLALEVLVVVPFYMNGAFTTVRVLATLAVVTAGLALLPLPGPGRGRAQASRADPDPDPVALQADPPRSSPAEGAPPGFGSSRNTGPAARDSRAAGRPAQPGGRR
jgi:hypothetical protein